MSVYGRTRSDWTEINGCLSFLKLVVAGNLALCEIRAQSGHRSFLKALVGSICSRLGRNGSLRPAATDLLFRKVPSAMPW